MSVARCAKSTSESCPANALTRCSTCFGNTRPKSAPVIDPGYANASEAERLFPPPPLASGQELGLLSTDASQTVSDYGPAAVEQPALYASR